MSRVAFVAPKDARRLMMEVMHVCQRLRDSEGLYIGSEVPIVPDSLFSPDLYRMANAALDAIGSCTDMTIKVWGPSNWLEGS